ncbi:MAG TPA: hypothetical protein VI894_01695 [Candidatus Nanoarchaeia archaeon]|nr:hypothetical protein [Candidatus Nanoarchaeia archaeon]
MKYKTKSIIIGRKKKFSDDIEDRPCFVSLFDINNPHTSGKIPKKILDFTAHKILIKELNVDYLLAGNDLVINDLEHIDVTSENGHVYVTGRQKKNSEREKE